MSALSPECRVILDRIATEKFGAGDHKAGNALRELLALHAVQRAPDESRALEVGDFVVCGALPPFILDSLLRIATERIMLWYPDAVIGDPILLSRWKLFRFADCEAKVHLFHRSDDDRAKHDHPWDSLSITLRAGATDVSEGGRRTPMTPGMIIYRSADYAHWIEVGGDSCLPPPMTLFVTGPKVREWGFLCPNGWKHWRDFTSPTPSSPSGAVGAGCDDEPAEIPFG